MTPHRARARHQQSLDHGTVQALPAMRSKLHLRTAHRQNIQICAASIVMGMACHNVPNGGSARGYQPGLRVVGRLAAADTGQRTSDPPTVYLCIGALGANVRI